MEQSKGACFVYSTTTCLVYGIMTSWVTNTILVEVTMPHFKFRNVNDAFANLVEVFCNPLAYDIVTTSSRNGPVLQMLDPCTITYKKPLERVLFNAARDANPFFHLFESLWMIAGRNDVASLTYFNKRMRDYSDDGTTFNGAYGYRWRNRQYWDPAQDTPGDPWVYPIDQLSILINHLKANPNSRRAVLQMWNVEDDLLKIDTSKDVCCNTSAYFSVRDERREKGSPDSFYSVKVLDMTVCNRSNDLIWGALGANVVHFSFLQEYMAHAIGVEVGVYNQFTNNLHVYTDKWEPNKLRNDATTNYYKAPLRYIPLVAARERFDKELVYFLDKYIDECDHVYEEPFFEMVAKPMVKSFMQYRAYRLLPAKTLVGIKDDAWRIAAWNWIERRTKAVANQ